jgi:hypothetical protein
MALRGSGGRGREKESSPSEPGIDHPNHWLNVRSPNTATYLMKIISVTITSRQIDIFFNVYHFGR